MTREDAIKHLENMKWLLGVNNTTVDDIPLTKVIDDIVALLDIPARREAKGGNAVGMNIEYTSDRVNVAHGQWIEYPECLGYDGAYSDDHIVCSNCKSVWSVLDNDTERFDYCPACGAKMREDE